MTSKMEQALLQSAGLTFEGLGFVFPTEALDDDQLAAPLQATVSVDFCGPFSGTLVLQLYGDLLPTIAMNMLGSDEPPSASLQRDALGEMGNVICGNVLPAIAGDRVVFNLRAPRVVISAEAQRPPAPIPAAVTHLGIEQGRADVLLFMSGEPEPTTETKP